MKNSKMGIVWIDSDELDISRRKALAQFWKIGLVASAAVMSLTACGGWSSSEWEVVVSDKTEDINEKRVKEGLKFPENGVVNISKEDGVLYYTLENSSEASLEMLEYSEDNVDTSDQSKNITWEYATFQVKNGNLKVEVIKNSEEIVTYKLSIVEGDEVKEVTFNIIPEGGEIVNTAPVLNSVSVSTDTLVDHSNNNYSISQNWDHDVTFTANWTDADGDSLQIVINWVDYSWTSETITLNLAESEIKQFYIKEFDWEEYSNEILVQVAWR